MPSTAGGVTAKGILLETIIEKPDVFKYGKWLTIDDLRGGILHEFDLERLTRAYSSPTAVWQSLLVAVQSLPWIATEGTGIETRFRVTTMPNTLPSTMNEALVEVKRLRKMFGNWKDLALNLIELTEAAHAAEISHKAAESLLRRCAALAFFYREQVLELRESRKMSVEPEDVDPTALLLESLVANPAEYVKVKRLAALHGIMTDAALEDELDAVSH